MARAQRADPDEALDRRARALASAFTTPRPGVEERMAMGKALRERLPQVVPLAILKAQAATRLQQLVPVRHARMLRLPFAFLRGSAAAP